jgi:hypothetical protein
MPVVGKSSPSFRKSVAVGKLVRALVPKPESSEIARRPERSWNHHPASFRKSLTSTRRHSGPRSTVKLPPAASKMARAIPSPNRRKSS